MTADQLHTDRVWRLVLCVALVLPSDAAWAQPPQRSEQVDVSRLVVDARVVDDDGRAMTGLDADDFDVRIGGQPVQVESAQWIGRAEPAPGPLASTSLGGVVGTGPRGRLVVFVVQKSLQRDRLAGLLRILHDSLARHRADFGANQDAAAQLVGSGEYPQADGLDVAELAAYTAVASLILNLDETVTKQ